MAILLVLLAHILQPPPTSVGVMLGTIYRVAHNGILGVDLFFVLSGFLITGILLDAKGGEGYFHRFYARRALRILPLYYLVVLGLVLWRQTGVAGLQPWYWFHATNWWMAAYPNGDLPYSTGHFWSLAIEEQFYLVWPLAVWRLSRAQLIRLALALCAVGFLVRLGLVWDGAPYRTLRAATVTAWDPLAVGAVLATLFRSPAAWQRLVGTAPLALAGAVTLLVVLELLCPFGTPEHRLAMPLRITAAAVCFGSLLVLAMAGRFRGVLTATPLRWLGGVSYAVYVFHPFVLQSVLGVWPAIPLSPAAFIAHQLELLAVVGGLTLGLAALSWRYFEGPLLALKRWVPMPRTREPGSAPALT